MQYASEIRPHMEVRGSDGQHVGTVDEIDGDRIRLTKHDAADGAHHHVPLSAVSRVDEHVHLNTTAAALGLGAAGAAAGAGLHNVFGSHAGSRAPGPHADRGIAHLLPWALLGLAVLALLYFVVQGRDATRAKHVDADADTVATQPLAVESVRLPDGRKVDLAPNSFNYSLERYLASNDPTPRAFTFDNLNFETASAAIRPQDVATVDTLAQVLRGYRDARVRVVGYTDAEGAASGNQALGKLRADAVAAALVDKGVAADRIETVSAGESMPARSNRDDDGRAENRRTELVVLAK